MKNITVLESWILQYWISSGGRCTRHFAVINPNGIHGFTFLCFLLHFQHSLTSQNFNADFSDQSCHGKPDNSEPESDHPETPFFHPPPPLLLVRHNYGEPSRASRVADVKSVCAAQGNFSSTVKYRAFCSRVDSGGV